MIQASELRIGNLVTDEWGRSIFIVDSINSKGIDLEIQDDGNWLEIAQTWIEPNYKFEELRCIPLTEEWLLKFGLFIDSHKGVKFISLGRVNQSLELYLVLSGNTAILSIRIDLKFVDLGTRVGKVHQLQNLYFSLTGSSLEILSTFPCAIKSEQ